MSLVASGDEKEESPWSKMKSKLKGLSGWILMPLRIEGLKSGLKPTLTPGAGRRNSWAWTKGKGPKVLAKKAIMTKINGVFLITI
jgi:hypothetical protein